MPTERSHLITYAGTILVLLGCFLPLTKLPGYGNIAYYDVNNPAVFILIAAAIAAPVLIFLKKGSLAFISPVGVWLVLLWPVIKGAGGSTDDGMMSKLTKAATDQVMKFGADFFTNIVDFSWGGFTFLFGILLLTVGGVMTTIASKK